MSRAVYIFLISFMLLLGCPKGHSQALPTATAPGAYISVGTTYSFFDSGYGQQQVHGAGAYIDINPVRQVGIEGEGRWLKQNQFSDVRQSTYLIGPRVQLRRGPYTPYIKTLAGLGYFEFPYESARGRYFVIAPGAGVDLMLGNDWKIRLIDVEWQQWPQFTFGTINPYGVSFGVSYRVFNGSR